MFSSPFWGSQLYRQIGSDFSVSFLQDSVSSNLALTTDTLRPHTTDTISQDTASNKKASLDAPVDYSANDSIVFTFDNRGYLSLIHI